MPRGFLPQRPPLPGRQPADMFTGANDISHPLAPGLAFDDKLTAVVRLLECGKKSGPIDFSGSDRDLLAPASRSAGANGVFNMDLANPPGQCAQRFDRVSFVVEEHVGGIEIDAEVWAVEFLQEG